MSESAGSTMKGTQHVGLPSKPVFPVGGGAGAGTSVTRNAGIAALTSSSLTSSGLAPTASARASDICGVISGFTVLLPSILSGKRRASDCFMKSLCQMRAVLFTAWQDKARSCKRPRARLSTTTSLVLEKCRPPAPRRDPPQEYERMLTIHFHRFARAKRAFTFNGIWYSEGQTGGRRTRRTYHTHTQDGMLGAAKHANIRNMGEIHRGMRKYGGLRGAFTPSQVRRSSCRLVLHECASSGGP